MKNIGESIKKARRIKGFTQVYIAKKAGITQTYLSQIESGSKDNPSKEILQKISDAIGIPVPVFLFMSMENKDCDPSKRKDFKSIKPSVDALIKEFFL